MTAAGRLAILGAVTALAGPAGAASPWDEMFPVGNSCYQRVYSDEHLAAHPQQRVTAMTIAADPEMPANPWPAVALNVRLRGSDGGSAQAVAWCENTGDTLFCMMEGDAGAFSIAPAKGSAVLVTVSRDGMGFETETGFVTLEAKRGDDRSFLLRPVDGCP